MAQRLKLIHHHTKFGYKQLNGSGDIVCTKSDTWTLLSSALADTMRSHISYQTAKSGPLTLTHLLSMSKVSDDADRA